MSASATEPPRVPALDTTTRNPYSAPNHPTPAVVGDTSPVATPTSPESRRIPISTATEPTLGSQQASVTLQNFGHEVATPKQRRAESRDTNQKYVQQVLTILGQLFPVTKPDASLGLLRRAEEYGALRRSGVRHLRRSSVRQLGCAVDRARAP
ncbi:hypothetical protein V5799_025703 [Amblyomma americanum]|uniref:Uncharacterized protein n=1 Tax=Amblyomma americanum TaxID=6943 RepID=A0AAQ4E8R3_AMBAM